MSGMAKRKTHLPVAVARWLLLGALVVVVSAVITIYVAGRPTDTVPKLDPSASPSNLSLSDQVLSGEGFDYEVAEGARRLFRIRSERIVSDREDRVELEQVDLEVEREDGERVRVTSERGVYQVATNTAILSGDVKIRDGEGLQVASEGFELLRKGRVLESTAPVAITLDEDFRARADKLTYHLKRRELALEGGVLIERVSDLLPAASLSADRLVHDPRGGTLRAEGSVELRRGEEFLRAARLSLSFGEDESDLRFVRAAQGVAGRFAAEAAADDLAPMLDFGGKLLYVLFEEGSDQPKRAELDGRRAKPAWLETSDQSGLTRRLASRGLHADFRGGTLSEARSTGSIALTERLAFAPDPPLRRICADAADASFDPEGEIRSMRLVNQVDFQEQGRQAVGRRIRVGPHGDRMQLTGEPASILSDQGVVEAPKIAYSADGAAVEALGGVRAELPEGGRFSLLDENSKAPIRVTADDATWSDDPSRVEFSGDVRAWQGADYVLADRLLGEPEERRLTASGNVKSVLHQQAPDFARGDNEEGGEGEDEAARAPVEVTASKLVFERDRQAIKYSGLVKAHQVGRTLRCQELDVLLGETERLDSLHCIGSVLLEDPDGGNKVTGDRLDYDPVSETAHVFGNPVTLTDQQGAQISGHHLTYDFASSTAQLESAPPPDDDFEDAS
jgi:lipopolysaccharide export system protein LptA